MRLTVETADNIKEKSTLNSKIATSLVKGFERKYNTSIEMLGSSDAKRVLMAFATVSSFSWSYCQTPYQSAVGDGFLTVSGCSRDDRCNALPWNGNPTGDGTRAPVSR